jgi:RimJ/RimL family protein N-acetyltransferase
MVRLEGESVVIRPLRADELDAVLRGRTQLGREALPGGSRDRARLQARIEQSGKFREGRIDLAIEADGRLVGEIQTYRPPDRSLPPAVYEIGVSLYDPADRGKGWGTEAMQLLVDWLFRQGAERVQGGTAVTNHPMRRVFDKLGFTVLGTLDVEGVAELLYGATKCEWQERSARNR